MKKGQLLLFMTGAALLTSCFKDKYDLQNLELDYNPTLAAPLIDAELVTKDLLNNLDTNLISAGSDNVLKVVFNDTVKTIGLDEFVSVGNQSINDRISLPPVAIDDVSQSQIVTLGQLSPSLDATTQIAINAADASGAPSTIPAIGTQPAGNHTVPAISEFSLLKFSKGQLALTVTNGYAFDITNLEIELVSVTNAAIIDTLKFASIPAGTSSTDISDLVDKTMSNNLAVNILSFASPGGSGLIVKLAHEMTMQFAFTNMEIVSGSAKLPATDLTTETFDIDLALGHGEELKTITFASATMDYSISYGVREDANLTLKLPFATKSGVVFEQVIPINSDNVSATVVTGSFDLTGYEVDLTKGGSTVNAFNAEVKATIVPTVPATNVPFDTSDVVTYDFTIKNIKPASVFGYFGNQKVDFVNQETETGISNDDLLNNIELTNPKVTMSFDNSFGIPMAFKHLDLKMIGGSSDVQLTGSTVPDSTNAPTAFNIAGSPSTGNSVTSGLLIGAATTNIATGINTQPTKFVVGGLATINPAGKMDNFADTSSKMHIRVTVEVPVQGRLKNLQVLDTMDLDLGELFSNLKQATLRATITNEFPLDGTIQILFTDNNLNVLDSLVQSGDDGSFMTAAATNAQLETTAPSVKQTNFVLNEETLAKLSGTKKAIVVARIKSANNGTAEMKILSTYNMKIKLALVAKVAVGKLIDSDN